MTLKLCGFSASNYYNKIKLQLMEKEVPFVEELVWTGHTDGLLVDRSPMGKVPFLDTPHGPISESGACAEYIEAAYPQKPLLPADPYAAAKVREILIYSELHLELVARNLYPEAFFGGKVSDEVKERTHKLLVKGAHGFAKLAKFAPYIAGPEFTLADCAAVAHLPLVSSASKIIYGEDVLTALPVRDYVKRMGERATMQTVNADRKSSTEQMMAMRAKKTA
ncbi:MAG: glutathione S-transferase [Hylemonella sp.]|nr:glutathione S-transferase [Hylemonella sp.]MDP1937958.1 glutathione S-transferase [Hylemonella sp.]